METDDKRWKRDIAPQCIPRRRQRAYYAIDLSAYGGRGCIQLSKIYISLMMCIYVWNSRTDINSRAHGFYIIIFLFSPRLARGFGTFSAAL